MAIKPERFAVGDQLDKLGRKLNILVDYVASLDITGDRASTIVRRLSPNRWSVSAIRQGGGGSGGGGASPYSGMFVVTDTTDYSGEAPYSYQATIAAGIAQCESKYISVAEQVNLTITQTGYITLEFDVAEADGAITQAYENKTAAGAVVALPLFKGRCIVAAVSIADNKLTVTQAQHGAAIVSIRTPEEPEEEETP